MEAPIPNDTPIEPKTNFNINLKYKNKEYKFDVNINSNSLIFSLKNVEEFPPEIYEEEHSFEKIK